MILPKMLKFAIAPVIALLSASLITHLQLSEMEATETRLAEGLTKAEYLAEETQYRATMAILDKLPPSSFDNLIADAAFLSFIQYFGDTDGREQTGYTVAPDFFQVAVNRDPLFLKMYPYLSASVTLFAGRPQQSIDLIDQAIQVIPEVLQPEAFFLGQAKGTDELLFLGQPLAAQKSYELSAAWASRSPDSQIQARGRRSEQTARFLSGNPDSRQAQVSAWSDILVGAIDLGTQQLAKQQIERLGGQVMVGQDGMLQVRLPQE